MPRSVSDRVQLALTAGAIVAGAALFVRMGGAGHPWLSPAAILAVLLLLLGASRLHTQRTAVHAAGLLPGGWLRDHRFAVGVASIMAVAFAIRLPHLAGDLGHAPIDIDENRLAVNVRDYFLTNRIGYETVEHYPGVVFWMMTGASLLAYLRALLDGTIHAIDGMTVEMFTETGRVVNVCIAAAIVASTAVLGRQVAGPAEGLIAALVVATVRMSVDTTTVLRNDPGQVLFLVITVSVALAAYRADRWAVILAAGVLAGVATGIKYTSVLVLLPVLLSAWMGRSWPDRASRVSLAFGGFVLATGITNHFVWADFPNFIRQLSDQVLVSRAGLSENPAALHLDHLQNFGLGWPLLLLAAGYGAYGLGTGRREAWIFWSFPLFYSWFTTQSLTQFLRWVFPLLPFAAVAGAAGLLSVTTALVDRDARRWTGAGRLIGPVAAAIVLAGSLAQPLWDGIVSFSRRMGTPTHEIVEAWVNEHVAGGTVLTGDGHLVFDSTITTDRVPLLRRTFGGGLYSRLVADWVVVPESDKPSNDHLRGFFPALRIEAGQGFGGNTGLDYWVYAAPRVPPATEGDEMPLADPRAANLLGHEWVEDGRGPGLQIPVEGAGLFLPPLTWSHVELAFEVAALRGTDNAPFALVVSGRPVDLSVAPRGADGARFAGSVQLAHPDRVTSLRLTARPEAGEVRVVRIRYTHARGD